MEKLWEVVCKKYEQACAAEALSFIDTDCVFVEDKGILFILRSARQLLMKPDNLAEEKEEDITKAEDGQKERKRSFVDPFEEPYAPHMHISDISQGSTQYALLFNKFNVVHRHMILITKEYRRQVELLSVDDLALIWKIICSVHAIAFYNCGPASGASQPHKHIQIVPMPLTLEGGHGLPLDPLVQRYHNPQIPAGAVFHIAELGFHNACVWLEGEVHTAESLRTRYMALLRHALRNDIEKNLRRDIEKGVLSYNLIWTRKWMMVVRRKHARCGTVGVNALGYLGTFLVRTSEEREYVMRQGPLHILQHCAYSDADDLV